MTRGLIIWRCTSNNELQSSWKYEKYKKRRKIGEIISWKLNGMRKTNGEKMQLGNEKKGEKFGAE